jgi:hypothetical protein
VLLAAPIKQTTNIKEREKNMSISQSWESWHGVEEPQTRPALHLVSSAAVLAEVPMTPEHPFYDEWLDHVESQPHQGC